MSWDLAGNVNVAGPMSISAWGGRGVPAPTLDRGLDPLVRRLFAAIEGRRYPA